MDNQCATISRVEAVVLVKDDTVDFAGLIQIPDNTLNIDDEMTDLSFDLEGQHEVSWTRIL